MASADSSGYRLDLDPPKRNVFVTQLNERDDDDDAHHHQAYPVVKERAGRLLETGVNTLQKTLLLKKEVEVDEVNDELAGKRAEFRARMEACAERQIEVQKKQQKMKDRVSKFDKFIKENEAKRRRAIQKYQTEVKLKEQKNDEHEMALDQLDEFKSRQDYLRNKLARYKRYEDYLNRVLEILPAHYLEVQDSMLNSLMMRHKTLSATNESLVDNVMLMNSEFERLSHDKKEINEEHEKRSLLINSELSRMKKAQEGQVDTNQELEQKKVNETFHLRNQRSEFGQILMAIDNIAEKSRRRMDLSLDKMDIYMKLENIRRFICDETEIVKMAHLRTTGSVSPTPEVKKKGNKSAGSRVAFTT